MLLLLELMARILSRNPKKPVLLAITMKEAMDNEQTDFERWYYDAFDKH